MPARGLMAPLSETRATAAGRLEWIGLRKAHRGSVVAVESAELIAGRGLVGDHAARRAGRRQVTLIQHEHLPLIARFAGAAAVEPAALRRNFVVSGVNLCALKRRRFRIGEVVLESTGDCHPCARMEETVGRGGLNAMRGHGGLTAVVRVGGRVTVGDAVIAADAGETPPQ